MSAIFISRCTAARRPRAGHVQDARTASGRRAAVHRLMKIALIGYGEVGRILAEDLRAAGHTVTAFDLKLGSVEGEALSAHALGHGVTLAGSHAEAVRSAELVI